MTTAPTKHIQTRSGDNVRVGPITIITLIVVVCMAVMGVLSISTAQATKTISDRQANATRYLYLDEKAGQEFVAGIDDALETTRIQNGSAAMGAQAVNAVLDDLCESARLAGDGLVSCTASVDGTTVAAEFICEDTRLLDIAVTILDAGTYRIERWKMSSAQRDAQTMGTLWSGE